LCAGVSLFHTPSCELMYSPARVVAPAGEGRGTLVLYVVEAGNTGACELENVDLCFSKEIMDRAVLPVIARNFGVSERRITVSNEPGVTVVSLGRLEPEKRVNIYITLKYPDGIQPDTWETLFLGVRMPKGRARQGDPGMTLVGRAWMALFGPSVCRLSCAFYH